MAAFIVRRRGHAVIRHAAPPVGLSFELRAMAGGAVLGIQLGACGELRRIARVGPRIVARRGCIASRQERKAEQ
jgi:hypothetical protein